MRAWDRTGRGSARSRRARSSGSRDRIIPRRGRSRSSLGSSRPGNRERTSRWCGSGCGSPARPSRRRRRRRASGPRVARGEGAPECGGLRRDRGASRRHRSRRRRRPAGPVGPGVGVAAVGDDARPDQPGEGAGVGDVLAAFQAAGGARIRRGGRARRLVASSPPPGQNKAAEVVHRGPHERWTRKRSDRSRDGQCSVMSFQAAGPSPWYSSIRHSASSS